jgi:hypothetical protein
MISWDRDLRHMAKVEFIGLPPKCLSSLLYTENARWFSPNVDNLLEKYDKY